MARYRTACFNLMVLAPLWYGRVILMSVVGSGVSKMITMDAVDDIIACKLGFR